MLSTYKLFCESILSQNIYHFTDTSALTNILIKNRLRCSNGYDEGITDDLFYVSFSRTKNLDISGIKNSILINQQYNVVCINFDGKKLSTKYKAYPISYPYRKDKIRDLTYSEYEDRLISDKLYIDNICSYIEEIHINIDNSKVNIITDEYDKIIEICKGKNIPIYFYENYKDFIYQKKANAHRDYIPINGINTLHLDTKTNIWIKNPELYYYMYLTKDRLLDEMKEKFGHFELYKNQRYKILVDFIDDISTIEFNKYKLDIDLTMFKYTIKKELSELYSNAVTINNKEFDEWLSKVYKKYRRLLRYDTFEDVGMFDIDVD